MIKAAIEKIQQLCEPNVVSLDGHHYLMKDGKYTEVKPELDREFPVDLSSLDALVAFVKTEAVENHPMVYITIPNHKTAQCFTRPYDSLRKERVFLYNATATDVPGWGEKVSLPFEEALIALRTRFQPTPDTNYALQLLSNITTGGKVTYNDNGIATSVVTKQGVDLQSKASIRPIINLRPYRTFQEVQQPESQFLIRINERAISFIEADGGMWKLTARNTVKDYLTAALAQEVDAGTVVISL